MLHATGGRGAPPERSERRQTDMHLIDVSVARGAVTEWLRGVSGDGVLVLRGTYDLDLGSAVTLRIFLEGQPSGVYLDGVVQWRRSASPTRGQPAALGVRWTPRGAEKVRFLERWGAGLGGDPQRTEWRYPHSAPVVLVTAPRGSARIYPCVWTDVSYGGAGIALAHRVEVGEGVRCEWSAAHGSGAVTAKISWWQQGRVGLRMDFRDDVERAGWINLIDHVRASLRSHRAVPREAHGEAPRRTDNHNPRLSTQGVMAVVPEAPIARHTPRGGVVREVSESLDESKRRTRDPRSE